MAEFKIAFDKTSKFEGGYANNPNDKGGETYLGIARNFFPKWEGWSIIDKEDKRDIKKLNDKLSKDVTLQAKVGNFYKVNFWDPIRGDEITDQDVANNIYDFGVNSGVSRTIKYMQTVLKVTVDGMFGPVTLNKLNSFGATSFVEAFKKARLDFLNKIVQNNPTQKTFLAGWTSRVQKA
jgi:lysozyme family protein